MKKLLLLLALCGIGFVACNKDDQGDKTNNENEEQTPVTNYDKEFQAKRFEGIYWGNDYSTDYNYYVILSDIGVDKEAQPMAGGTYYIFDLYSNIAAREEGLPTLPNGTYTFDAEDSLAAGTFSNEGSWAAKMDAEGDYEAVYYIESGSITVQDNKFDAVIKLTNGEEHHITYNRELYVATDYILSTFSDDIEFSIEGATFTITNHGNENDYNKYNWGIEAVKGDDYFVFDIYNSSADSVAGLYTNIDASSTDYNNKFVPGIFTDNLIGCWYAKLTNGTIKGDSWAPMTSGAIQIAQQGDAITITFGCMDDAGNNIGGSVAGTINR